MIKAPKHRKGATQFAAARRLVVQTSRAPQQGNGEACVSAVKEKKTLKKSSKDSPRSVVGLLYERLGSKKHTEYF